MLYQKTEQLLDELEASLLSLEMWETERPSRKALTSTVPFATDTLEFHQWLQFIMIPQLRHRIKHQEPLPSNIAVSPYAIHIWRGNLKQYREVILTLRRIDTLLSGEDPLKSDR